MGQSVVEPSGRTVAVQLTSGRVFTGDIDSRTDRARLWLRHSLGAGSVLRPIDWVRVVRVKLGEEVYSGQQFHRAVSALPQTSPTDSALNTEPSEIVLGPAQTEPKPPRSRSTTASEVRSLAIEARLANWDADVEADGLIVHVFPLDLQGAPVPVHGRLEVTLMAEQVGVVQAARTVPPASADYSPRRQFGRVLDAFCVKGRISCGAGIRPPFPQVGRRPGMANVELAGGQLESQAGGEKASTCSLTRR